MKTLVVYYSRKGTTAKVAQKIAEQTGATVDQITVLGRKPGVNVVTAFFMSLTTKDYKIEGDLHHPGNFDHVIIVTPIWMGRPAPQVASYITKYKNILKNFSYVTVSRGRHAKARRELGYLTKREPTHLVSVRRRQVKDGTLDLSVFSAD